MNVLEAQILWLPLVEAIQNNRVIAGSAHLLADSEMFVR